jgi:hypothetical protein
MHAPDRFEIPTDPFARPCWRRRLLLGGLVFLLLLLMLVGYSAYVLKTLEWELAEVRAELDRSEPGWRFEDLYARRRVLPEHENAAFQVLAAQKQLPDPWPVIRAVKANAGPGGQPPLADSLAKLSPEIRLAEWQSQELRAQLQQALPALTEARKLAEMPYGRYTLDWPEDFGFIVSYQGAGVIAKVLKWDAFLRAHDGDYDGALASCRGSLNAGRSVGDEPTRFSLMWRLNQQPVALAALERTLGQGEASEAALATIQRLLETEAAEPLLLMGLRWDRAGTDRFMEAIANGQLHESQLLSGRSSRTQTAALGDFVNGFMIRRAHPAYLRAVTQFIEIAKLPVHEQASRIKQLEVNRSELPGRVEFVMPIWNRAASMFQQNQAMLRCAIVAVTLERYRLTQGRWPETLAVLTPALLPEVPLDPYDGAPLRYRRLDDGVVVYALGPDGADNGGTLDRKAPMRPGTDLGFRLWDVTRRRQPYISPAATVERKEP